MLTLAEQAEELRHIAARTQTGFWYNNRHSSDFHLYVEKFPDQVTPRRKVERISIPGRSGDLHFAQDAFENITQTYICYFHAPIPMPEQAQVIKEWLLGAKDGAWLRDAYMLGARQARFVGPMDIQNYSNRYGRCVINFDCSPQIYTPDSLATKHLTSTTTIQGNAYPWLPLIKVHGSGSGTISVGQTTVRIHNIGGEIILDSELEDAYRIGSGGALEPANGQISTMGGSFPVIKGSTPIAWAGGVTSIDLTTRGWTV